VDYKTGIRPTVLDRRPLLGKHPKYQNLAVFNGLGTRGIIYAPALAEILYEHLENATNLDTEMDIDRFKHLLDSKHLVQ
jgi:glycine/D-amino acid oxidase-like deaminating enzyme